MSQTNLFRNTRIYLSGPMDFVGSRVVEKFLGWRSIVTPILRALGVHVLDPWNKPVVKGHREYGNEGIVTDKESYLKDFWTNKETRARFEADFWETVHIDCRMVDISDSLLAFVPTNIYSVGTVHEIVLGRNQFKPVLMVSPPISYEFFPALCNLPREVKNALKFYGLKENPHGIPSQWYGTVVGGNNMFDGFGWEDLPVKSADFYPRLLKRVMELARPASPGKDLDVWHKVSDWLSGFEALQKLSGGVLDHVVFQNPDEETMLRKELESTPEKERDFFWYDTPYSCKRPVLYQLFSIASGHIPTRTTVISKLNAQGEVEYQACESIDDNWLLMAPE